MEITPPSGVAADFPLGGVMWWYTVLLGNHHTASNFKIFAGKPNLDVSLPGQGSGGRSTPSEGNMLIERAVVES